jgi:hypothetical protein
MATSLSRIQAYISPDLHQQFLDWKQERGFGKDSQAFSQLLSEYFAGVGSSGYPVTESLVGRDEAISKAVDAQIGDLEGIVIGTVNSAINDLKSQLIADVPSVSELHELIEDKIQERLAAKDSIEHELREQLRRLEQKQDGILEEINVVVADEKSLLSSLAVKVMSLQAKLDGLSLAVRKSSELPGELPSELPGELPSELSGELPSELTEAELAKRLDISKTTLSRNRNKPNFSEWTQARDPEALAWEYDAESKLYRQKPKSASEPVTEKPEQSEGDGKPLAEVVPYDKTNPPQVGDRCYSEMSGKEGRVITQNSRHTCIWWDKDKTMGLGPVQYSASDLEVMRICKREIER